MDRISTKGQMIDQIDLRGVPHSGFDRSNHNYGTGKLGTLIPARLDEVYPGDRIKGNPEMVVNFEPLAAPLMGSMVLKQESFYVPYPQLWRHAYKFFTGKNGFNDPMPSVSPRGIWDVYESNLHSLIWLGDYSDSTAPSAWSHLYGHLKGYADEVDLTVRYSTHTGENKTLRDDLLYGLSLVETFVEDVYGTRKMLDLVQPAVDSFKRFVDSKYARELSEKFEGSEAFATLDAKKAACRAFALSLGDCFEDFFIFFHGPSSLFDYLGWPTVLPADMLYFDIDEDLGKESVFRWLSLYFYNYAGDSTSPGAIIFIRNHFSQVPLSFMPFKAYYLIWYWNYRDQLLETGILDPEDDEFLGTSITSNVILYCTILRQRCWFKDTFTTALTNTGDGNLVVPTVDTADGVNVVYWDNNGELINTTDADAAVASGATYVSYYMGDIEYKVPTNYLAGQWINSSEDGAAAGFVSLDLFDRIKRLRSFVQKRLVLGYEVDDVIWSSFMVRLSNVRMHIPEILGRGRDAVQINTIVNNTSTDQQIAGDKTATAWAHGKQSEMNYFSEEWGLFLTFTTVMPIQSYAGGMQRLYLKRDRFDYMWPEFATMGMDAVYNCELAALGSRLTDTQGLQVFGYQGRYYDLKSRQDEEHGRLLTDLNYLTFSREWDKNNPPKLNYIFVHCWPRLDGFVVESPLEDVFRYDCYNAHAWERRLPVPSEIVG